LQQVFEKTTLGGAPGGGGAPPIQSFKVLNARGSTNAIFSFYASKKRAA